MSPPGPRERPIRRRAIPRPLLFAGLAALVAGLFRGATIVAVSDESYHLLRAGSSLLQGSLVAYSIPPGGAHAPLLGAWSAALGDRIAVGTGGVLPPLGAASLAAGAALLAGALWSRGALVAVFGVALFLLPPAFAVRAVAHPDAALGGMLLLAAAIAAMRARGAIAAALPMALATAASLATPAAIPALAAFALTAPRSERRFATLALPVLLAILLVASLSMALPAGSRFEIVSGLFAGWGVPGVSMPSTIASLLRTWGEGIVLLGTFVAAGFALRKLSEVERRALLAGGACMAGVLLFATPRSVASFVPAIAPLAALGAAILVSKIPDPMAGVDAPRRPLLVAIGIAVAILLGRASAESRRRDEENARCERMAQIAQLLPTLVDPSSLPVAERTGSLAFHAKRPVLSLASLPSPAPALELGARAAIFFEAALAPVQPSELAVFRDPAFLQRFAPRLFRRGVRGDIEDAFWAPREVPGTVAAPAAYRVELARGFEAHARGRIDEAARAFAAAVAAEPEGLGIAREWSGMQEGALGRKDEARARFEDAVARDPATARARGHLADIAISRGELARADELLAQAILWNDDDAETWGTVARLAAVRGDSTMARRAIDQAIQLAPGEPRLRMNAGSMFWRFGETERAKQEWATALQIRPELARYLGDFRRATASDPPPPFLPLFTFDSFDAGAPPRQ